MRVTARVRSRSRTGRGPFERLGCGHTGGRRAIAASLLLAAVLSGCGGMTPAFAPTVLEFSPDADTGPDYVAEGSIDSAGETVWFELELRRTFNTVVVMTMGDTDTAGRVETQQRVPVEALCEGARPKAARPCVWGYDPDILTPNQNRTQEFNSMPASRNFLWEGSLDAGTYFIGVTGERGATGAFRLTVEIGDEDCPVYYCDE